MQKGEWLKPGQLNKLDFAIQMPDGTTRKGMLRLSHSQHERFQALIERGKEGEKAKDIEFAHIALNPDSEKEEFSQDEIKSALDVDEISLMVRIWIDKKIANPRLSEVHDPKFFQ